uniref:NADH dehydrogenase subunit 6 n=1 Tax=Eurydice pulchra TaxID=155694 RepID=E3SX82_EURPU|nr:NADH dehydrogenase subunit 6 [Eurydice pulchra]
MVMTGLLSGLILVLSSVATGVKGPHSLALVLGIQIVLVSLWSVASGGGLWGGLVLFLVFLGGLLIVVTYMVGLAPQVTLASGRALWIKVSAGSIMGLVSLICLSNGAGWGGLQPTAMYSGPSGGLYLFIVGYLLLALLCVVNLTEQSKGPLRLGCWLF